jgi:hypothetical protein
MVSSPKIHPSEAHAEAEVELPDVLADRPVREQQVGRRGADLPAALPRAA